MGEDDICSQAVNSDDEDFSAEDMICAGGASGAQVCSVEHGSPLTVEVDGRNIVTGVSSWTLGCGGDGRQYAVYSELAKVRTWIEESMAAAGGAAPCNSTSGWNSTATWGSWGAWSECSENCDKSRERDCLFEDGMVAPSSLCDGCGQDDISCSSGSIEYEDCEDGLCGGSTTEGTTTEGGEDDIEATVKSLIDAGTCDGVTYATDATTDYCGDAATSYYKEFLYNGKRVIVSNNIPDHPAEQDALAPNPNIRCAGWQFVQLEVDPLVGNEPSVTDTGLGTIGLAVPGGAGGPSGGGAPGAGGPPGGGPPGGGAPGGGPPGGRFQRQTDEEDVPHGGIYHYHGNLNCSDAGAASGANDPDMCVLLGYYLDGVPVYGLCKDQSNNKIMTSCYSLNAGAATSSITTVFGTYNNLGGNQNDYTYASNHDCNLDEASGALHPTTGKYSYFMSTDYPWIPIKFMASRSTICGFTP